MANLVSLHGRAWALAACLLLLGTWAAVAEAHDSVVETYGARRIIVHVPDNLPAPGSRALVIVLHGGLGNADRIASQQAESALNMDAVADRNDFIVAYLSGTPVTRFLGSQFLGWNAGGGCCGQPAERGTDDVAYIKGAVHHLAAEYGIDPARIYGTGHSNGAMMTQRMVCETHLYAAAVAISGPLNLDVATCPAARGTRILAIHGADDQNVPINGGVGERGLSRVAYKSEAGSQQVFIRSGAAYTLQIVPGADHKLDHIDAAIRKTNGVTIAEESARFFGLLKPGN